MTRQAIGKKLRFEVFKRDRFTCQYCGSKAPDVVLHVDHIDPVSKGGASELVNLITSCAACNLGKGARALDDASALAKQRQQLEELEERRAQLEMMVEWQQSLVDLDAQAAERLAEFWASLGRGFHLNETGVAELRQWITKHSVEDLLTAMRTAATQYFRTAEDGTTEISSVNEAWGYVPKIASVAKGVRKEPFLRDALYIRGILKRRFHYVKEWEAKDLILRALNLGSTVEAEKRWACEATSWSNWRDQMLDAIADLEAEES